MKLTEVTAYKSKTATILKEGYQDLTETQVIYLNRWEKELWPLVEQYVAEASAQLTPDQIQDIFKGAESVADATGDNKNMLGKAAGAVGAAAKLPVDIAKAVDKKINELGRMAQNAGPVKNMDQKFEQLKKDITANNSDSKIVQGIQKVSDWAKENPGKASIAVGILTTMAAFAGGPMGGAAAGLVLRASKDLLQGEKLSTAVGKSVKTAAYGALAGLAIQGLTDGMVDNIATGSEAEAEAMMDGFQKANFDAAVSDAAAEAGLDAGVLDGAQNLKMSGNINGFNYSYDLTMTPEQVAEYKALSDAANSVKPFSPEYYEAAGKLHGFLSTTQQANTDLTALAKTVMAIPKDQLTGDQLDAAIAVLDKADVAIEKIMDIGGTVGAAAQGALQTVDSNKQAMHNIKPIDPEEKKQLELDLKGGENAPADDKVAVRGTESFDFSNDMEVLFDEWLREADPAQKELPLNNPNSLGGKLKRGLGKAAGAVGTAVKGAKDKVKAGAKELTSNVTAAKLNAQWKKMGEPSDAGSIYNLLSSFGMDDSSIQQIATGAKVELKPAGDAKTVTTAPGKPEGAKATGNDADAQVTPGQNLQPGDTMEIKGQSYKWNGKLWDGPKGQPIGIADAAKLGLPNPRFDAIVDYAKKNPQVAKLIKDQLLAKGVKPGTKDAQIAKTAGAKGTEKLKAAV
jgi:uncharacterized protein YjbJ (UPF0337 family)